MIIKLSAVIILTPIFLFPGVVVAILGAWCGQIYIKAQLSVKREMSNARSPVLGHFGAAISGLGWALISFHGHISDDSQYPFVHMVHSLPSRKSHWFALIVTLELPGLFTI
jgi:hypothetical protein